METTITSMPGASISFPFLGENFSVNPSTSFKFLGINVYFYGLIIAIGFLLGLFYCLHRADEFGLTQDNILDMVICSVPSAVIGARILYVITNSERYFAPGKWLDIVKIWEGGLAIYGGLVLAVLVILIYAKKKQINIGLLLDVAVLGLIIGQVVGRWGNFINRELFGTETDSFFRMGLTLNGKTTYVHPTFLYESFWNLIGFIILHFVSKKYRKFHGQIFLMYVVWYGLGRTFIDSLRVDVVKILGGTFGVYQFIALVTFCIAAIILIILFSRNRGKPFLKRKEEIDEGTIQQDITSNDKYSESKIELKFNNPENTEK